MALPLAEQLVADALEKGSRFDRAYLVSCAPGAVETLKALESSVPAPLETYVDLTRRMLDAYPRHVQDAFLSGRPLEQVVEDMCVSGSLASQDAMVEGEPVPVRRPTQRWVDVHRRLFPMVGQFQAARHVSFYANFIRSFKSAISGHA